MGTYLDHSGPEKLHKGKPRADNKMNAFQHRVAKCRLISNKQEQTTTIKHNKESIPSVFNFM